jgi:hypothetical protein
MSAYGVISKVNCTPLQSTLWPIPVSTATSNLQSSGIVSFEARHLTVHHLTLALATPLSDLVFHLHTWFAEEVKEGLTYPQEGEIQRDAFEAYFFAADVFVAIIGYGDDDRLVSDAEECTVETVKTGIEQARSGRPWEDCVAGFYYVSVQNCMRNVPLTVIDRSNQIILEDHLM